jgi:Fur family ferric uptake transcriptional regulator
MDEVAALLHRRGERMTRPREAVITALAARSGHVSVEDVLRDVSRLDPRVHRASVYRTLEALSAAAIVQHVHLGHGGTVYHIREQDEDHLYVQCRDCRLIIDVPRAQLDAMGEILRRHYDFELHPTHVALSGLCGRCRARRATGPSGS